MKNQIEFHSMYTNDPFTIDPADIVMTGKWLDGAVLHLAWEGRYGEKTLEVTESYETVKRMLADCANEV